MTDHYQENLLLLSEPHRIIIIYITNDDVYESYDTCDSLRLADIGSFCLEKLSSWQWKRR